MGKNKKNLKSGCNHLCSDGRVQTCSLVLDGTQPEFQTDGQKVNKLVKITT